MSADGKGSRLYLGHIEVSEDNDAIRHQTGWMGRNQSDWLWSEESTKDLFDKVSSDGPAAAGALKDIVADPKCATERRYCAMGFLVALFNQGLITANDVIPVLRNVTETSIDQQYSLSRMDALGALAELDQWGPGGGPGVPVLIEMARDPRSRDDLRREALLALAQRPRSVSAETLAWGVLELPEATDRFILARALGAEWLPDWNVKVGVFVTLLAESSKDRSDIDAAAVLYALRSRNEPWARLHGRLVDFLIHSAEGADERMSGNFAALLIECFGGNPEEAGYAINVYERNHKLPETSLKDLRIQVGGAPALSGIVKVLKDDLDKYFQQPIQELNKHTMGMWQDTLKDARSGFQARIRMSIAVFCLGVLLVLIGSYMIVGREHTAVVNDGSYAMLAHLIHRLGGSDRC